MPAIQALRVSTLDAIIAGQQHIVGVTGIYAKSSSELLGFNFILASKNDIIIDAARLCMRQYGFLIRDDLSILDPLDLGTKVDVYGYSAQARFGDNKTPKPDALDLIETIKWNNWNAKKGIDP